MDRNHIFGIFFLLVAYNASVSCNGIGISTLEVTYVLDQAATCNQDTVWITTCQTLALNPSAITGVHCRKFNSLVHPKCCCYLANTNACCHFGGGTGIGCIPSSSPNKIYTRRSDSFLKVEDKLFIDNTK